MAQQSLTESEIKHYTNWWCRRLGFKSKDLEKHPQMDDVILLVNWTNEFWDCPDFWKPCIKRMWSYTYYHKLPLKTSHINKLGKITVGMIKWRKNREQIKAKVRTLRKTTSS